MRVPAREIDEIGVNLLLQMIHSNSKEERQYTLDTELIVRVSCSEYSGN